MIKFRTYDGRPCLGDISQSFITEILGKFYASDINPEEKMVVVKLRAQFDHDLDRKSLQIISLFQFPRRQTLIFLIQFFSSFLPSLYHHFFVPLFYYRRPF
ncbi:hypothetical protein EDF66_11398 [Sphingobacterium sp. JUb20]|nr:hypothetical protein [Sphingobacterium sp. JUb21]TCQ99873.1 hypothetical protein EDF66_11398 [Sphingobacterium sp. JUb20]